MNIFWSCYSPKIGPSSFEHKLYNLELISLIFFIELIRLFSEELIFDQIEKKFVC